LGILQNLDVSESALKYKQNGKEVWISKRPTSDRQCSDWQRTLSDDEALTDFYSIISHGDRIVPNTIRKLDTLLTYAHDRGIHADVIVYIFAHLHTTLRTEGSMLDKN